MAEKKLSPENLYELQIQQRLEVLRLQIIQEKIEETLSRPGLIKQLNENAVKNDNHIYDIFFSIFSLCFYPHTQTEKTAINISTILNSKFIFGNIGHTPQTLYQNRLHEVIEEQGKIYFWEYLRKTLEENSNLTQSQKESLSDLMIDYDPISREKNKKGFYRLLFVMLGVLYPNNLKNR